MRDGCILQLKAALRIVGAVPNILADCAVVCWLRDVGLDEFTGYVDELVQIFNSSRCLACRSLAGGYCPFRSRLNGFTLNNDNSLHFQIEKSSSR